MAQKRTARGRPRRGQSRASGFPATRKKTRRAKTPSTSEPTSAFEALMQVTSAELERLNNNNSDNRSDSSSKSAEENRNVHAPFSSPSDVVLPAWYGVGPSAASTWQKPKELILPPKKKKYLHYLADADDDNKIINDPFNQPESATQVTQWASMASSSEVTEAVPDSVVPQPSAAARKSPEQLAPLKFNPAVPSCSRIPDGGQTLNDVLEQHITRLISENDQIVSKQNSVTMSKRGRSRETGRIDQYEEPARNTMIPSDSCMVKNLLSSKLNRKNMAKEIAEQLPSLPVPGTGFAHYLNPEKSAIKDLLIKTYEEKGCPIPVQQEFPRHSIDYRLQGSTVKTFSYRISSNSRRGGALVMLDSRQGSNEAGLHTTVWNVMPGNEWVFVDERGRKRVRPEMTVFPETAAYQTNVTPAQPSPAQSLRSPSVDSAQSSESMPSSVSHNDSLHAGRKLVQTNGTFQPGRRQSQHDAKHQTQSAGLVRTAGIFHPFSSAERRASFSDTRSAPFGVPDLVGETGETHEKTLNALRGHLTGKKPSDEAGPSRVDDGGGCGNDVSMLPPKKRKSFHLTEKPVVIKTEPVLQPVSPPPQQPTEKSTRRGSVQRPHAGAQIHVPLPIPFGFLPNTTTSTSITYSSSYQPGFTACLNNVRPSYPVLFPDHTAQYGFNQSSSAVLLQKGHDLPSFRYSCVPTNTITTTRPAHVASGKCASVYADVYRPTPSVINPVIHVDSSAYGKKKIDGSYFSSATKKTGHVGPTSVENYKRKAGLIHCGMNSFLPAEAARLTYQDQNGARRMSMVEEQKPSTSGLAAKAPSNGSNFEDVSEDEEEECCAKCRRKMGRGSKRGSMCLQCHGETNNKKGESTSKQSRKPADRGRTAEPVPEVLRPVAQPIEKQLLNQRLHQKIISHQHQLPHFPIYQPIPVRLSPDFPLYQGPSQQDHAAVDLTVRKQVTPPVAAENVRADWLYYDGSSTKFTCSICGQIFQKESSLSLHSKVHDLKNGRPEKKSKATRERSTSPNGTHTSDNPRPFYCGECSVGFRIHGHLQKHLRSKTHITQLECTGRLQCGFYAELERQNMITQLHQLIETTDCSKAFTCLSNLCKNIMPAPGSLAVSADEASHSAPAAPSPHSTRVLEP